MATVYVQRAIKMDAMVHHLEDRNITSFHILLDVADYHQPDKITFEELVIQWKGSPDELRHALTVALNNAFEGRKV